MNDLSFDDEKVFYKVSIPVLVKHINYGNHLGYDSLLTIIQDARMFWLKNNGMTELSIEGSIAALVTEAHVNYHAEAFHGDILDVAIYVSNISRTSFLFHYKVNQTMTKAMVATAMTKHVFLNLETKRPSKASQIFIDAAGKPN